MQVLAERKTNRNKQKITYKTCSCGQDVLNLIMTRLQRAKIMKPILRVLLFNPVGNNLKPYTIVIDADLSTVTHICMPKHLPSLHSRNYVYYMWYFRNLTLRSLLCMLASSVTECALSTEMCLVKGKKKKKSHYGRMVLIIVFICH